MKLRYVIVRAGTIACGLALLWHFSNIARYGEHLIQEPIPVILILEIIGLIILLVFACLNLARDIRREYKRRTTAGPGLPPPRAATTLKAQPGNKDRDEHKPGCAGCPFAR